MAWETVSRATALPGLTVTMQRLNTQKIPRWMEKAIRPPERMKMQSLFQTAQPLA